MVDEAPGWSAIDAALQRVYPGVEPKHLGTIIGWRLGGPDPLDGISIYQRDDHWHFVSFGLSELYEKESEDPDESGWGFEFTFRLARPAGETEPPIWAANFLQNLARYVFKSGNAFGPGHHVDLNGPISLADPDTAIRAITFTDDPELGVIDTPHGRLRFLQIVGLTLEEYGTIERWDAAGVLDALRPHLPLLVTDLGRRDLTADPGVAAAIEQGARRDGSSTGSLFVQESSWTRQNGTVTITFGANPAPRIARVVAARLPHGRGLLVEAPSGGVGFLPGERLDIRELGDGYLEIELPPPVLTELTQVLRPLAGTYPLQSAPGLTVRVVKSQIRDQDGAVVSEIG